MQKQKQRQELHTYISRTSWPAGSPQIPGTNFLPVSRKDQATNASAPDFCLEPIVKGLLAYHYYSMLLTLMLTCYNSPRHSAKIPISKVCHTQTAWMWSYIHEDIQDEVCHLRVNRPSISEFSLYCHLPSVQPHTAMSRSQTTHWTKDQSLPKKQTHSVSLALMNRPSLSPTQKLTLPSLGTHPCSIIPQTSPVLTDRDLALSS